jgi:hypothetical protein
LVTFWLSCLGPFGFIAPKDIKIIWLSNRSALSVHDEGYYDKRFDNNKIGINNITIIE